MAARQNRGNGSGPADRQRQLLRLRSEVEQLRQALADSRRQTAALAAMRVRLAEERGWPVAEALERAMVEDWGMRVALGRAGTPRELGDVIAFLLSERASYVSGALVNVDGGTDF